MKRRGAARRALALLVVLGLAPELRAAPVLNDALTGQAAQGEQFFDGKAAAANASAAPAVDASTGSAAVPLVKSAGESARPKETVVPRPASREKKRPSLERIEDRLFTISWWMYHATWAADTMMTGLGLSSGRGFYETDPANTLFGNRNVLGVVGSLAIIHIAAAGLSLMLHRKAKKHHGWVRTLMESAAIGINVFGTIQHVIGFMSWVKL